MKNKLAAALLALFLGGFGIHKFYLGQVFKGFIYLIFFWTAIPAIIAFFEAIVFLVMSDEDFDRLYNPGKQTTQHTTQHELSKKCPFCAEEVKFDAIKCKHCGSAI